MEFLSSWCNIWGFLRGRAFSVPWMNFFVCPRRHLISPHLVSFVVTSRDCRIAHFVDSFNHCLQIWSESQLISWDLLLILWRFLFTRTRTSFSQFLDSGVNDEWIQILFIITAKSSGNLFRPLWRTKCRFSLSRTWLGSGFLQQSLSHRHSGVQNRMTYDDRVKSTIHWWQSSAGVWRRSWSWTGVSVLCLTYRCQCVSMFLGTVREYLLKLRDEEGTVREVRTCLKRSNPDELVLLHNIVIYKIIFRIDSHRNHDCVSEK
jgi:hypothetical protein